MGKVVVNSRDLQREHLINTIFSSAETPLVGTCVPKSNEAICHKIHNVYLLYR